jgi:hypothetical protein
MKQAVIINLAAGLKDQELLDTVETTKVNALQDTLDKKMDIVKQVFDLAVVAATNAKTAVPIETFTVNSEKELLALNYFLNGIPNSTEHRNFQMAVYTIGPAPDGIVDSLTKGLTKV